MADIAQPSSVDNEQRPSKAIASFLSVYELLLELFSHADTKSAAVAARSSKVLTEPALDVLWRVVPRASYLFSILSTLDGAASYDGHNSRRFDFDRDLHPEDWDRFLPYSRRVEEISCYDEGSGSERYVEPSHKALAKFSTSRPAHLSMLQIFPRLHRVTWFVYSHKVLRNLNIFLVPSLAFIEIKIDNAVESKAMVAFLKQLQARCGDTLKELRINTDFSLSTIEAEMLDLLKSMTRLERVVLPRFYSNGPIISALAALPCLQFIGQKKSYWWGNSDDIEAGILPALESFDRDAFPALRELTYDTLSLYEAKKFLSHNFAPKKLTTICVTSGKLEAPHSLHDFLSSLATNAHQLREIDIGLSFPVTEVPGHSTDITISTLRPLLLLPDLVHFGMAAHFPIKMTDEDLDTFTSGWKNLKTLWLNETPAYAVTVDVKSEMTLKALRVMAKNCPNLEELSLFIDATTLPEESAAASSSKRMSHGSSDLAALQAVAMRLDSDEQDGGPPAFKALRYLNLGVSHIGSTSAAANYINACIISPLPELVDESVDSDGSPAIPRGFQMTTESSSSPNPNTANGRSDPPSPAPAPAPQPTARSFSFDWSPRFWPAPVNSSEMDTTLTRRREMWEDVGKMIPALMEQKVKADMTRREMVSLIRGLMKANVSKRG
ncbi:hypothetical protein FRB94_004181 [Tulasnella sp. JGI-2019a]|nr:hypothetical protein FRB93_005898 [Tulasnella sp. JGI-2019a]KAG9001976.1 hypothetical protein FRB94_004181 [Tulasnella sp. JGI-2019a]